MRWVLVSSRSSPSQGGVGTSVDAFARAAVEAGWSVDLVTRAGASAPPGVTVHEIHTQDEDPAFVRRTPVLRAIDRIRPYRYGLWSLAAARYLAESNLDADVVEWVDVQAEGVVALTSFAVRERLEGVPMIVHAHTPMFVAESRSGFDPGCFGRHIYHEWERRALQAADGVIAPAPRILREISHVGPSLVVPPVVPAGAAPKPDADPDGVGREILLVGAAEPHKGVEAWVLSLNYVLGAFPDATARHIGLDTPSGPDGGSMIEHLRDLLEARWQDRFRTSGPLDHDATQRAISRAALVIVPSRIESFSYVAAEALTQGIPVAVSEEVGILEHVPTLPSFPADDVESMAGIQIGLLADLDASRARARAQRERLLASCSAEQSLDRRRSFVQMLRDNAPARSLPAEDSMDTMQRFLSEVEEMELDYVISSESPESVRRAV